MPLFNPYKEVHPGYLSSRAYTTFRGAPVTASAPAAVDIIYFYPFTLPRSITFTNGIARVQTGGAASSMKMGVWANSPISNRPLGAPLYKDDTGVATTASTTDVTVALGAGTLMADTLYWAGGKFTGTLPTMWSCYLGSLHMWYAGSSGAAPVGCLSFADAYANALPTIAEAASFSHPNAVATILFLST